ncbi:MAG: acetyl ornithine aminotransferase family protein [Thermoplasmata archaeon]
MTSKAPHVSKDFPGPNARKIIARDTRYLVTSTKTGPIVAKRARGALIEDVDGNVIIDLFSGVGVQNVGHCHPEVVRAIKDQADKFIHIAGTDYYYDVQVRLAEKLAASVPGKMERKVFFTNSGTESVEAAIKVAKASTKRHTFIGFIGAFHGRTIGSLSVTASKPVHREGFFPFMPGVYHIPYAYCYRCRYKLEYPSCGLWCAKILEEVYFDTFVPPGDVAAIIAEPIQGEGGYVIPPKEFLPTMKRIAEKHGILFVDDEIQAGMGRTGKLWAIEHFNVVPDVITTAKALGAGIPIGATIIDAKLDFDRQGRHSNTFGGNPVGAAAALAVFRIIEKEKLLQRAQRLGKKSIRRLKEMEEKYGIIGDTRGLGLMLAHEFVKDKRTKAPNKEARDKVTELALRKGLGLLGCGKSSIRYLPPLIIEEELLETSWDILEDCIRTVDKH